MGRSAKECDSVGAFMLRATCALLAVLIPGVAACTFDRSGSLPGPAPMPDGREEPDAMPMDALTSDSDAPSSNDREEMEPDSSADAPADRSLGETDASRAERRAGVRCRRWIRLRADSERSDVPATGRDAGALLLAGDVAGQLAHG